MTFEDLEFKPMIHQEGIRAVANFDNGYGASIVKCETSYGNKRGLYELAVLYDNMITYDTEITDDVLGYLTPEDVTKLLERIEAL